MDGWVGLLPFGLHLAQEGNCFHGVEVLVEEDGDGGEHGAQRGEDFALFGGGLLLVCLG